MSRRDPRLTPARDDLAARHLQGEVSAPRYVDGVRRVVVEAQAPVRRHPAPDALLDTEALHGEYVTVYDTTAEGWCWGQLDSDGYVGWLPASALGAPGPAATHRVRVPRTLVFPGPSIKLPPVMALSLGARFAVTRLQDGLAATAAGYVPAVHLAPPSAFDPDPVAVAERFLGTPYLWGGKTGFGLDCSGLVQLSLSACGIACPRDSDMQEEALGHPVSWEGDPAQLRRGDLLFWPGHVALVRDGATLIHANAHHMAVVVEETAAAIARIAAAGSRVRSVRRL